MREPLIADEQPKPCRVEGEDDGEAAAETGGPIAVYLDWRALTRECVGRWLQSSLTELGLSVYILPDPEQIATAPIARRQIRTVIINTSTERMDSGAVTNLLSRVRDLLPVVPVVVLSDHEDAESIREAFALGVRGYIPTSLTSAVAVGAMSLVSVGGMFAPPVVLLSQSAPPESAPGSRIKGFTQRQAQILECLRRGLPN